MGRIGRLKAVLTLSTLPLLLVGCSKEEERTPHPYPPASFQQDQRHSRTWKDDGPVYTGETQWDREGFGRDGYDRYGFDREGRNRDGYDKDGFHKDGFDRQGYNRAGYSRDGFDKEGYASDGFDRTGFDRQGRDRKDFDRQGFDKYGYTRRGYDRHGVYHPDRDLRRQIRASRLKPIEAEKPVDLPLPDDGDPDNDEDDEGSTITVSLPNLPPIPAPPGILPDQNQSDIVEPGDIDGEKDDEKGSVVVAPPAPVDVNPAAESAGPTPTASQTVVTPPVHTEQMDQLRVSYQDAYQAFTAESRKTPRDEGAWQAAFVTYQKSAAAYHASIQGK